VVFATCVLAPYELQERLAASDPSSKNNAKKTASLGDRIVAFCKEHKGKQVGDGECSSLADAALRAAGARHRAGHHWRRVDPNRVDPGPNDDNHPDDYVWGDLVCVVERDAASQAREPKVTGQLQDVRPGDIIQFRDAQFAGPNRSNSGSAGRYTKTATHHTAVVSGVSSKGTILRIYQQNINGRRVVMADRLVLVDLQQGRLRIFRPLARTAPRSDDWPPRSEDPDTPSAP
jgi:hypothetical protein